MKRIVLTFGLCIGFFCFSCESNTDTKKEITNKPTEKEVVKTSNKKREATIKPDTVINGRQVYNLGKDKIKSKAMSLEECINIFDSGVNGAKTCEELIRACATFDANIKRLIQNGSSITVSEIEKRDDVRAIRRISEEKSLVMCQTQQMR